MSAHHTEAQVAEYASVRHLVPGTLLWATNVPLSEDAFRIGGKNSSSTNFLRYTDLKMSATHSGRIEEADLDKWHVEPGQGISLFIKQMLPEAMIHLGTHGAPETPAKPELKKQYDPLVERYWWKIEKGQVIPSGLQLVYDGEPPGHCTLTVERQMTVRAFLALVSLVHFQSMGTDYYGQSK